MSAVVLHGPGSCTVEQVAVPHADAGWVVVEVERVGVCGTDLEFHSGEMAYLHTRHASFPMRLGHEWCGVVTEVGADVDRGLLGRRVTGDTMIGCGHCRRCRRSTQHVCDARREVGIRGGLAGALADRLTVPARSLHPLPDDMDPTVGALVEPGGNAVRAARAARVGDGDRALVVGPGTIGLLTAMFLRAHGAEVHLVGVTPASLAVARELGFTHTWAEDEVPALPFDAVIDATNARHVPARAVELVEPSGRVVFIGLAGTPSEIDTRDLVLGDVTAVGILSASGGLDDAIAAYADGTVDPRPLVAATVPLDGVADVLSGRRPAGAGPGPKVHVDPHLPGATTTPNAEGTPR